MDNRANDLYWMRLALEKAHEAALHGEVPVGAVLTLNGEFIASGANSVIGCNDPSAHAEIITLREAGKKLGNYRFPGAHLYVTLEPCTMCMGALIHARIERLIFGALDPKTGAAGSLYTIGKEQPLNHQIHIVGGVLSEQCSDIITAFFKNRRKEKKT